LSAFQTPHAASVEFGQIVVRIALLQLHLG
jgi:hypothetical protein